MSNNAAAKRDGEAKRENEKRKKTGSKKRQGSPFRWITDEIGRDPLRVSLVFLKRGVETLASTRFSSLRKYSYLTRTRVKAPAFRPSQWTPITP